MYVVRDRHLIFHACVPVDERGEFLEFEVDGKKHKGKAMFDALNVVVRRALRHREQKDLDMLWYLWGGPLSPWFGKDKMATFESYFVADAEVKHETKNPYFKLIHEKDFCRKILKEFGITSDDGLIVNGHVPVKIEKGESPLKKSGMAVTIDGAFSEAYGDKGYTLVLEPERTFLAQHYHFASVDEAVTTGADIIPSTEEIRRFPKSRLLAETEKGPEIVQLIEVLEMLIQAYRHSDVRENIAIPK
jgi:fructose-1,6-bisphosphatase-3